MWQFNDRLSAGLQLAETLSFLKHEPGVLVLALPRGGVPVAYEVARAIDAPLDIFIVRKLGVPGREELAMGAIATGGVLIINQPVVDMLTISQDVIHAVAARELKEIKRREKAYRGDRSPPAIAGRLIVLVDDGLATGSTMLAAIRAVRQLGPRQIVGAVPVAPPSTCEELRSEVDQMICLYTPEHFFGVGQWYRDFSQTSDDEVVHLLSLARSAREAGPAGIPEGDWVKEQESSPWPI